MKYVRLRRNIIKNGKLRKSKRRRRRKLDPARLREWSLAVRGRDMYRCKACRSSKKIHAHHLVSKYYVPRYAFLLENGISLCKSCHLGSKGVHGKGTPKNGFIKELRAIYYSRSIKKALLFMADKV
ncbi:MAG: hypothetical protein CMQ41_07940 [Gammaproteobacteria bacterium]|nr:hypothetical protein [Gammaproteobacteria bacterium]